MGKRVENEQIKRIAKSNMRYESGFDPKSHNDLDKYTTHISTVLGSSDCYIFAYTNPSAKGRIFAFCTAELVVPFQGGKRHNKNIYFNIPGEEWSPIDFIRRMTKSIIENYEKRLSDI